MEGKTAEGLHTHLEGGEADKVKVLNGGKTAEGLDILLEEGEAEEVKVLGEEGKTAGGLKIHFELV